MCEPWPEPLPLIESTEKGLAINRKTAQMLDAIRDPVIVVSIAGIYRTGKSYLMNRLAGLKNGFALGSTVQSKTKGIWVWCRRHPDKPNKVLVLLDTEGLSDAEKGDEQYDMQIFSLAVLLCSTFVFNAIGKIDQEMINKLYFVTELTERIRARTQKSGEEDEEGESRYEAFTEYFPDFVLAVRDFTLDLEIEGTAVTPDEYFDHILQLKKGRTKSIVNYNLPREAIRGAFKSHRCFVFTRPVQDEKLFRRLEEIKDDDLAPTFLRQSSKFINHILEKSKPKRLTRGQEVNGRTLMALAQQYVECINNGAIPCIESAVELVAKNENRRLEEECAAAYLQEMTSQQFPLPEADLNALHTHVYTKVMAYFRKQAVFDKDGVFLKKIMDRLTEAFKDVVADNLSASRRTSLEAIETLYADTVQQKMKNQVYTVVGGYKIYDDDMKMVVEKYKSTPGLGSKKEEVLNEFLQQHEDERITIMKADSQMTEREKEIEAQTRKRQAAEMQAETVAKELKIQQDRVENLCKEHQEQFKQAKEEFKKKEEQQKKDMEELLQTRLQEQKKLHEEGMAKRAQELQDEIDGLKKSTSVQSGINTFMDVVDRVLGAVQTVMAIKKKCDEVNPLVKTAAKSSGGAAGGSGGAAGRSGGAAAGSGGAGDSKPFPKSSGTSNAPPGSLPTKE